MQAIQFPPFGRWIPQQRENDVHRVEHDAAGLDLTDFGLQGGQHPDQVETSGLEEIRRRLCIEKEEFALLQGRKIPAETRRIGNDAIRAFLEGHEDAGFIVEVCPVHEGL